jgi:deoxyribonuclease V
MLACVDVSYEDHSVVTGGLWFTNWPDEIAAGELVLRSEEAPQPYESGQFYKRELPYIVRWVEQLQQPIRVLIVDGYVWLGTERPGLGAHVYEALKKRIAVIGVAKRPFHESPALPVLRGESRNPLFVTSAGMDASEAAEHVRVMHGEHRIPTLLKRADALARGFVVPDASRH